MTKPPIGTATPSPIGTFRWPCSAGVMCDTEHCSLVHRYPRIIDYWDGEVGALYRFMQNLERGTIHIEYEYNTMTLLPENPLLWNRSTMEDYEIGD